MRTGRKIRDGRCRLPRVALSTALLALVAGPLTAQPGGGSDVPPARSTRAALRPSTPVGALSLAADLGSMLHAKVRNGTWGAMVVSLTNGDTLFAENASGSLNPASTMKLYTTALAFERLGTYHRFTTDVLRDGRLLGDGTLAGNLVLRGGGDPALSRRFFDGDANAPMRTLARQVAAAGIRRVSGDVIGDEGAFEAKPIPDGWLSRYLHSSYAARVSALSLNENLLYVVVSPAKGGSAGAIRLEPATTALTVVNSTKTVAGSRATKLRVSGPTAGKITVRGTIGALARPQVYVVVVNEPAEFATGAFVRALTEAGIAVTGQARLGRTPEGAVPLTGMSSPPLRELATIMNRESVNHFAEMIFRNVARTGDSKGVGTAEMGNALLKDFLALRVGALAGDVFAADGSGLSTLDRVTPRSMVQLLAYAHRAPWSRDFHESLPVAGRQETLRLRMRNTPAQGNLHAKTGTTADVVALSGFVSARDGEVLAFSFVYNGKDRWNARETIDAMGATLAGFVR